jgi:hypothetical protein
MQNNSAEICGVWRAAEGPWRWARLIRPWPAGNVTPNWFGFCQINYSQALELGENFLGSILPQTIGYDAEEKRGLDEAMRHLTGKDES